MAVIAIPFRNEVQVSGKRLINPPKKNFEAEWKLIILSAK